MKYILHIAAKLHIGGAEKVARDIGLYADSSVWENHYVVFGEDTGAYEPQLLKHGCKVFHMDPPGKSYAGFLKNLKMLMLRYPYTAVHAHTMFNAGWVMAAAKKMGVPVRVAHSHSALTVERSRKVKLYEAVMRHMILSGATDLVACGEQAGIRLFGEKAYRQKGRLILNGIDTAQFQFNENNRREMRRELGLEDSFVIGHAGHLAPVKNQKFLLERMPEILRIRPEARLLLLGEGQDRAMLEKRIRELDLTEKVIMTGNVMNVPDYLCAMDVFAFPSLYEGMPLSIVEVQTNGLPCVISTGVPKDVYLTDLIHPVSLEEPEQWVQMILRSQRSNSDKYGAIVRDLGLDVSAAMETLYKIYEKD